MTSHYSNSSYLVKVLILYPKKLVLTYQRISNIGDFFLIFLNRNPCKTSQPWRLKKSSFSPYIKFSPVEVKNFLIFIQPRELFPLFKRKVYLKQITPQRWEKFYL